MHFHIFKGRLLQIPIDAVESQFSIWPWSTAFIDPHPRSRGQTKKIANSGRSVQTTNVIALSLRPGPCNLHAEQNSLQATL